MEEGPDKGGAPEGPEGGVNEEEEDFGGALAEMEKPGGAVTLDGPLADSFSFAWEEELDDIKDASRPLCE